MSRPPGSRGRGRPAVPLEQQRRRLLDAAIRSFQRTGPEGTGVAEIVREAGMSSRSFYALYGSKEALVDELVRDSAERFLGAIEMAIATRSDPLEEVDAMLRAFLELLPVVTLDLEKLGGALGEHARAQRRVYFDRIIDRIHARLSEQAELGVVSAAPDRFAIELVIGGIEALALRYHREGRDQELAALRPKLLQALVRVFG